MSDALDGQATMEEAYTRITTLEKELAVAKGIANKLLTLQKEQVRFRDPERTMLCDILANGKLDHQVRKYPDAIKEVLK